MNVVTSKHAILIRRRNLFDVEILWSKLKIWMKTAYNKCILHDKVLIVVQILYNFWNMRRNTEPDIGLYKNVLRQSLHWVIFRGVFYIYLFNSMISGKISFHFGVDLSYAHILVGQDFFKTNLLRMWLLRMYCLRNSDRICE